MVQGEKQTIKKNSTYYLTMTVVDWIDVFTRENHKRAILNSLKYCIENKGLNVFAYCVMTNHLHLIVNTNGPFELKDTIRDFKRHKNYKLWQAGNHAIEIYSSSFLWDKINYIHANPVKEEFVNNPEDWKYSSASNYVNDIGILEKVICLPKQWKTY